MTQQIPLKSYMAQLRRYMNAFASVAGKPQQLTIARQNVYWTQGKAQELYCAPIDADPRTSARRAIPAAVEFSTPSESEKKLTKEEEMLRERSRSLTTGIKRYYVRETDGAIFFISGVDLYIYYPEGPRAGAAPLKVFDYLTPVDKAHFASLGGHPNVFMELYELTTVTFVNSDNVYKARITEDFANESAPLAIELKQISTIGTPLRQCGVADYIIQEEFMRYTGHYSNDRYVLYSYTDSSHMRSVTLLSSNGSPEVPREKPENQTFEKDTEEIPYPRVGDSNAHTTLVVYDTETEKWRVLPPAAVRKAAPWVEYIPRFGFKDKETIYLSALSRTQETFSVLTCPVDALPFIEIEKDLLELYDPEKSARIEVAEDEYPTLTTEWTQNIDFAWVEIQPESPLHYGTAHDVLVCHAAETPTSHYHLYSRPHSVGTADPSAWTALTSGAWNVQPGTQKILDGHVYFLANADGRLKRVLYRVPLGTPEATVQPLTPLDEHVYSFAVKDDHLFYVSSTQKSPATLYGSTVSSPGQRTSISVPSWVETPDHVAPEHQDPVHYFAGLPTVAPTVVTTTSRRGVPLAAAVFVSPAATREAPGPLALFIYGGPHVQLFSENDYDCRCKAPVQVLLQHGISVAVVDNQMSNANGLRDLSVCKKNMGNFETSDYVDMVKYLCNTTPAESGLSETFNIDVARVAIFGWSYGGYATLLAMCQAPDVFSIGFAGAPVGDWKLYDTGYTERYMGTLYEDAATTPNENEAVATSAKVNEAYMNSTISHYASGFPEECNRLYIAHGLLDENVHFSNTCHVVKALIDNSKPYNMLLYPGERHGLRQNIQSRLHHDALLVKTLHERL